VRRALLDGEEHRAQRRAEGARHPGRGAGGHEVAHLLNGTQRGGWEKVGKWLENGRKMLIKLGEHVEKLWENGKTCWTKRWEN